MANHNELRNQLKETTDEFHRILNVKNEEREALIKFSRETTKNAAKAIRLMHKQTVAEFEEIENLILLARQGNSQMNEIIKGYPDLFHSAQDAQKELVEAEVVFFIMKLFAGKVQQDDKFPNPDDLNVEYVSYLHGLGEVVGELRRFMLDCMIEKRFEVAQKLFEWMEFIHGILCEFTHYSDALTGNIRRVVDISRSLVEKSRGELAVTLTQENLRKEIERK